MMTSILYLFHSIPQSSSNFLSAILVSLIETRNGSIELCFTKRKISSSLKHRVRKEREREREKKEEKKSVSFFFWHNRQMEMLSSGHRSLSFSLLLYARSLSLSLPSVRSHGFLERDNCR